MIRLKIGNDFVPKQSKQDKKIVARKAGEEGGTYGRRQI